MANSSASMHSCALILAWDKWSRSSLVKYFLAVTMAC